MQLSDIYCYLLVANAYLDRGRRNRGDFWKTAKTMSKIGAFDFCMIYGTSPVVWVKYLNSEITTIRALKK